MDNKPSNLIKDLIEKVSKVKTLHLELKASYETIKELETLIGSVPDEEVKNNLDRDLANLKIDALLKDLDLHNKLDEVCRLGKIVASEENKKYKILPDEDARFKSEMYEKNPAYFYYESLGVSK